MILEVFKTFQLFSSINKNKSSKLLKAKIVKVFSNKKLIMYNYWIVNNNCY